MTHHFWNGYYHKKCPPFSQIIGMNGDCNRQRYSQLDECENLATVDLVGAEGIRKTISSLLLERWRDEMNQEINSINQVLPNTPANEKTNAIQGWIRSVIDRMEHYKVEHNTLLKEDMTQLEP